MIFDCRLDMEAAVRALATKVKWEIQMLLRSQRTFSVEDLVIQYKQQVLTFIGYRTGTIYHASKTVLNQLDVLQTRFFRELGIAEEATLINFSLALYQCGEILLYWDCCTRLLSARGRHNFVISSRDVLAVCFYMTTNKVKTIPC